MKKLFLTASLVGLAFLCAPAFADQVAGDGQVTVPWGDTLYALSGSIITLAGAFLAFALARLPASVVAIIKTWQVDQLLQNAIGYGVNSVAGAARGQELSLPVGNKVLETALEYALQNGSPALINWMGGADVIQKKIIARLDVAPSAVITPQ